ncbi:MAG: metallophosphoesterase [Candidatus Gracilibacteria bacterium]|nr:metallophosphoesterase [Candidatus Gracilibacteria bacterium]
MTKEALVKTAKSKESQAKIDKKIPEGSKIVSEEDISKKIEQIEKSLDESDISPKSKENILQSLNKIITDWQTKIENVEINSEEELKKLYDEMLKDFTEFEQNPEVKQICISIDPFFKYKDEIQKIINLKSYARGSGDWRKINARLELFGLDDEKIRKIQEMLGVEVDGKVGPETIRAMQEKLYETQSEVSWGSETAHSSEDAENFEKNFARAEKAKADKGWQEIEAESAKKLAEAKTLEALAIARNEAVEKRKALSESISLEDNPVASTPAETIGGKSDENATSVDAASATKSSPVVQSVKVDAASAPKPAPVVQSVKVDAEAEPIKSEPTVSEPVVATEPAIDPKVESSSSQSPETHEQITDKNLKEYSDRMRKLENDLGAGEISEMPKPIRVDNIPPKPANVHRIVVFGDSDSKERVKKLGTSMPDQVYLKELQGMVPKWDADFVLGVGDHVYDKGGNYQQKVAKVKQEFRKFGETPYAIAMGNHDLNRKGGPTDDMTDLFKDRLDDFEKADGAYSYTLGGATFVVFNKGNRHITEKQIKFFEKKSAAASGAVFLINHIPPFQDSYGPGLPDADSRQVKWSKNSFQRIREIARKNLEKKGKPFYLMSGDTHFTHVIGNYLNPGGMGANYSGLSGGMLKSVPSAAVVDIDKTSGKIQAIYLRSAQSGFENPIPEFQEALASADEKMLAQYMASGQRIAKN